MGRDSVGPVTTTSAARADRDRLANLFTTWVVLGLFLDGWAHNAGKPEDFWTPWHGVLYSGFLAGFAYFAWRRRRERDAASDPREERIALVAFIAFAIGGAGDGVWHTLFGVEEDVAALLSPTHLMLMIAGLVLVTGPLRERAALDASASWSRFWPIALGTTLGLSVLLFFLQFASAFHVIDPALFTSAGDEAAHIRGVTNVLLTNAVVLAWLAHLLGRWAHPPVGTITFVVGVTALLMAGLEGFAHVELVLAPVVGGVAGDVLLARGAPRWAVLVSTAATGWLAWFGLAAATFGLGWEIEFWTGTLVFAGLTGFGLHVLLPRVPDLGAGGIEPAASVTSSLEEPAARG